MKKRVMVFGDSNSWGYLSDGLGIRCDDRWPVVMARTLNVDLIEECLPGRTTAHTDPDFMGEMMNGLKPLPVSLKSQSPINTILVLLGTNDMKARFEPSAEKIAKNISRLVECARQVGGGQTHWEDETPPQIYVVVPPPLPPQVDDPTWERCAEWFGGRNASLGLFDAVKNQMSPMGVSVFDAGSVISGAVDDPIHWTKSSQIKLGKSLAKWIEALEK